MDVQPPAGAPHGPNSKRTRAEIFGQPVLQFHRRNANFASKLYLAMSYEYFSHRFVGQTCLELRRLLLNKHETRVQNLMGHHPGKESRDLAIPRPLARSHE